MVDEGCSLVTLPLFISFNFGCVCVCMCVCMFSHLFLLITVKNTETQTNTFGFFPTPLHLFRMVISSHNRQRQKRVGMKTPKATRIGNMRLLLSEA